MRKTRRALYRRKQRGGGSRWWVLLGALAALKGTHANEPGFRDLVSKWWYSPTVATSMKNSIELGNAIASFLDSSHLWTTESAPKEAYAPPPDSVKAKEEDVVAVYLPEVGVGGLTYGPTYEYDGATFQVDTWSNKGDTAKLYLVDGSTKTVPIDAKFKVLAPPPDEKGGIRRRKTLRRKK